MFRNIAVAASAAIFATTALAADPPASNVSVEGVSTSSAPAVAEQGAPVSAVVPGSARIRLFGRNGFIVDFFANSTCLGGDTKTGVSGSLASTFSSFLGKATNVRLGIKDTPNTLNMAQKDATFSKGYFREYSIVAGQPLTVRMSYSRPRGLSCGPIGKTFLPVAGKDYEAILDVNFGTRICTIILKEVQETGTDVILTDVEQTTAEKCP